MSTDRALALDGIHMAFDERPALRGARLHVRRGTVHALLGENGAGKSTLMRVAAGLVRADAGTIQMFDEPAVAAMTPQRARALGLGMVHQHFALVDTMTVAENVVLAAPPAKGPLFDRSAARERVRALAVAHGLDVDPDALTESLPVSTRQRVEILKALYTGASLLVLDEPTAVLAPAEIRALLGTLRKLRESGATIVIVTHKLDEVMAIADEATVLRAGETVATMRIGETTPEQLAHAMVGREVSLDESYPPRRARTTEAPLVGLSFENVHVETREGSGGLFGFDLEVRAGEIVGIAGVEGNGQRALEQVAVGLVPLERGAVRIRGRDVSHATVGERLAAGLRYIAGDRHREALALAFSLRDNVLLPDATAFSSHGVIDRARVGTHVTRVLDELDVRPRDPDALARTLSGGNQQKLVVARALTAPNPTYALVVAHPTRGVDVAAAQAIRRRIARARDEGLAVLLFSSELPELLALADRIAVLVRGRVVEVIERAHATIERVGEAMLTRSAAATGAAASSAAPATRAAIDAGEPPQTDPRDPVEPPDA